MNQPFTFGIELEMMVALVREGQQHPDPTESRIVVFPARDDIIDISRNKSIDKSQISATYYLNRVAAEFSRIIREAGFTVAEDSADSSGWAVIGDTSLCHPPHGDRDADTEGYAWCGVEIKTPALPFTTESLQAVRDVCTLVQKHFKILVNTSCGLHVHVGHGKSGFSTYNIAKIMAFIYTFEPQISTLHPIHRYTHEHGKTMRDTCNYTQQFQRTYGERPSTLMTITKILTLTRHEDKALRTELAHLVTTKGNGKNGSYNFNGITFLQLDFPKPTIEFRQHEGTMDGERITQWIKLVVGMVSFIENEEFGTFVDLLMIATDKEKWKKLGDGQDAQKEAEMGPIPADGALTIIDLLRHIGLNEQADYYHDKVWKHHIPMVISVSTDKEQQRLQVEVPERPQSR
ncbi:hypothetical protein DL98DRAFT_629026 [Cadophora sp. DSE1049]|nr:hypothetical protein DL98DRAFT_629026 [Cadophora sp. DSE1049]